MIVFAAVALALGVVFTVLYWPETRMGLLNDVARIRAIAEEQLAVDKAILDALTPLGLALTNLNAAALAADAKLQKIVDLLSPEPVVGIGVTESSPETRPPIPI